MLLEEKVLFAGYFRRDNISVISQLADLLFGENWLVSVNFHFLLRRRIPVKCLFAIVSKTLKSAIFSNKSKP